MKTFYKHLQPKHQGTIKTSHGDLVPRFEVPARSDQSFVGVVAAQAGLGAGV